MNPWFSSDLDLWLFDCSGFGSCDLSGSDKFTEAQ